MKAAIEPMASDAALRDESAPVTMPSDEAERLASLLRLAILDTPPAEVFDSVARLAAAALRIPILLVSFVDSNRLWFKSRIGLTLRETPRQHSFCAQTVSQREPLVVRDVSKDERFAKYALVLEAPHVRSYVGIPLYSRERHAVGTLCAMDVQPREFGDLELVVLTEFAKILEEFLGVREVMAKGDGVLQYAIEREKLFRDSFDSAPVALVQTSLRGDILRINQRASSMLGYAPAQVREMNFLEITHPEDTQQNVREFKRALAGEIDSYRVEQRLLCKDQRYLNASVSVALKRTAARQTDYSIVAVEDIGAQRQSEAQSGKLAEALRDAEAALGIAQESTRSSQQALHYSQEEVRRLQEGLRESQEETRDVRAELAESRETQRSAQANLRGAEDSLLATKQALLDTQQAVRDTEAALRASQDQQREAQAALQSTNAKLAAEIATDSLTGLTNRRSFSRRSEQAAAALRTSRKPYGVILLDLDNFKNINDEYGHDVGDDVLRALGGMLMTQLRNSSDMAARLGGDEFAVLCFGDINEQTLHDVAQRIHTQIAKEPLATPKGLLRYTGSFGLALSMSDDPDWKTVYGRANAALHEAKSAGKDRISFGRSQSKNATARLKALNVSSSL